MPVREAHRQLTRQRILDAVLDLVSQGTLDEFSVPAVARQSDVSLATIYRYFPTKADLLAAAAQEPSRRAMESPVEAGDDFDSFVRTMWRDLADNLPLLRHQIASAAGREMRTARLERSRLLFADYLSGRGIDPKSVVGQRLTAVGLLLTGSLGLVELHDRQSLPVEDATDTTLWAMHCLIDAHTRS